MGNAAFEKNSSALITVKDGKVVKVQIAMNPVTVTSIYSAVTAFEVEGVTVTIDKTEKITTSAGNEVDAIRLVTFELPEGAQPSVADITYADVSFKVPDTPMGDTMMSARLRFDWSALTATSDTSLVPAEDQTEEKSPAVDVTDEKTGIHVSAAEGVLPEGSELKVIKGQCRNRIYKGGKCTCRCQAAALNCMKFILKRTDRKLSQRVVLL